MTRNYYLHTYLALTLEIKSNVCLWVSVLKTCFYSFLRDDQLLRLNHGEISILRKWTYHSM